MPPPLHFDVLILGAGLSGIGTAHHLQTRCPSRTYAILEARDAIGGTWDLFRYPGVRSDSDMFTLGYRFRPWRGESIVDGASIRAYIEATAAESGITSKIRFGHRVTKLAWSSEAARWLVTAEVGADRTLVTFTCRFLLSCTGYFDYEAGYTPALPGRDRFRGPVVHPQAWPEDLVYAGRRVLVIGSGATAITLVPALAESAAHVVMLQRSPTYVAEVPVRDAFADAARRYLPDAAAYAAARWKNVATAMFYYGFARRRPKAMRRILRAAAQKKLGPGFDVDTHFSPRYEPWDERMCAVPNGDLFRAIRSGRASVVTDTIETFTERGVRTSSGAEVDADIIVTATGLNATLLPRVEVEVDGEPIELASSVVYKGMMYSDVPNLVSAFGYANASWTLRSELTAAHACRILEHMGARGYVRATPRLGAGGRDDRGMATAPLVSLKSGYLRRARARFPVQGTRDPWRLHDSYVRDVLSMRLGRVDDGVLEFSSGRDRVRSSPQHESRGAGGPARAR